MGMDDVRKIPVGDDYRIRVDELRAEIAEDRAAGSTRSRWSPTAAPSRPASSIRSRRSPICAGGRPLVPRRRGVRGTRDARGRPPAAVHGHRARGFDRVRSAQVALHAAVGRLRRRPRHGADAARVRHRLCGLRREGRRAHGLGIDLGRHSPNFSRGFWALKVWVSLLAHGRKAYGRRIPTTRRSRDTSALGRRSPTSSS